MRKAGVRSAADRAWVAAAARAAALSAVVGHAAARLVHGRVRHTLAVVGRLDVAAIARDAVGRAAAISAELANQSRRRGSGRRPSSSSCSGRGRGGRRWSGNGWCGVAADRIGDRRGCRRSYWRGESTGICAARRAERDALSDVAAVPSAHRAWVAALRGGAALPTVVEQTSPTRILSLIWNALTVIGRLYVAAIARDTI